MKERIERKLNDYIAKILEKETLTTEEFGLLMNYCSWLSINNMSMYYCDTRGGGINGL